MRHDVSSAILKEFILPDPTGDIEEVMIAELADKMFVQHGRQCFLFIILNINCSLCVVLYNDKNFLS